MSQCAAAPPRLSRAVMHRYPRVPSDASNSALTKSSRSFLLIALLDWGRSLQEWYPDRDTFDHRHIDKMGQLPSLRPVTSHLLSRLHSFTGQAAAFHRELASLL